MKLCFLIIFYLWNIKPTWASIGLCKSGTIAKVCKLVDKLDDYIAENSPAPLPTTVKVDLQILDILDVDQDAQTITLQTKVQLVWIDNMLRVNRSDYDIEK